MPYRVADYFVVCGLDPDQDLPSSDVWENQESVKLKSTVLDRVPPGDHKDAEFPQCLEMFCFPDGFSVATKAPEEKTRKFSFVLTEVSGTQLFCTSLVFYESQKLSSGESKVAPSGGGEDGAVVAGPEEAPADNPIFVPKCICLVSHWPFFSQSVSFVEYVYNVYKNSSKTPATLPLERIIINFLFETPFPPLGRVAVQAATTEKGGARPGSIVFKRPAPNKLPLRDFSLIHLFRLLSVDNIILIFSALLNERRVLFTSNRVEDLTIAAETFKSLLFPMIWRHIYVPVLPEPLIERVCAPFPYMMGITTSCQPDELLMEGVMQVNLHKNEIVLFQGGEELNRLPDKLQTRLHRGLKKVVSDTAHPLGPGSCDEKTFRRKHEPEIEDTFLRFFVKVFKDYKQYMEAPSEEAVEKYDKEKFLREHSDNSDWLKEVMDTQMFQCFIDERYEYSHKTVDNFEVLFFDELIESQKGSQSPFLSDTSQDHNPKNVESAMVPNRHGLDPTKKYEYPYWPKLDPNLMLEVRKPKKLITQKEEKDEKNTRINMSKIAMKFFKEKRLYSQHFHSLKLHSRKQNIYFNSLVKYFKAAQSHEERCAKAQMALFKSTLGEFKYYPTATTIDAVWGALKTHLKTASEMDLKSVREVGSKCCQDLYTTAFQKEASIDLLLDEAQRLGKKAGVGKNVLERAKAKAAKSKAKWRKLKKSLLFATGGYTGQQVVKVVGSQNMMEDAILSRIEAETGFRTILNSYESRMPRIVNTIRSDNIRRIEQFKTSMTNFIAIKKAALASQARTLAALEETVKAIDTAKDMESFTQGTSDFWHNAQKQGVRPSGPGSPVPPISRGSTAAASLVAPAGGGRASFSTSTVGGTSTVAPPPIPEKRSIDFGQPGGDGSVQTTLQERLSAGGSAAAATGPPPPLPSRDDMHTTDGEVSSSDGKSGDAKSQDAKSTAKAIPDAPATAPSALSGQSHRRPALNQSIDAGAPGRPMRAPPLPPPKRAPGMAGESTGSAPRGSLPPPPPSKAPSRKVPPVPAKKSPPPPPPKRAGAGTGRPRSPGPRPQPRMDAGSPLYPRSPRRPPPTPTGPMHTRSGTAMSAATAPPSIRIRHTADGKIHKRIPSHTSYWRGAHAGDPVSSPGSPGRSRAVSGERVGSPTMSFYSGSHHGSMGSEGQRGKSNAPPRAGGDRRARSQAAPGAPSGVLQASEDMNNLGQPSYTLNLWGDAGFTVALTQAMESKAAIKKFGMMLDEWGQHASQIGRRWESTYKALPSKVDQDEHMTKVWLCFKALARTKCTEYHNVEDHKKAALSSKLIMLAQGLRFSKGKVKQSMRRYKEHREKLLQEVKEATVRRDTADNEVKAAEAKYNSVKLDLKKAEQNGELTQMELDRMWKKVDLAKKTRGKKTHHLQICETELTSIIAKRDYVMARVQTLFEMKERESQAKLKHVLKFLATNLQMMLHSLRSATENMSNAARDMDYMKDLHHFLTQQAQTQDKKGKGKFKVSFNDLSGMGDGKVTMAECLGVKGFESAVSHAQRNIAFTKQIEAGLQSMMSVQEEEIKLMKRWMASYARKQTSTMLTFPVHDGYSLVTAFHALAKVVQELMKFWGATHDGFQKFERGLHSLRTELKQAVKNHVKRHEQELKMHETARREKDAAVKDLAKAVAEEKRAMAAHTEAQRAADRGAPVKKGIFRGWGKEDVHKLKAKMDKAIREKNKCDDALKRKSQALEKASENLSQRTREQLEQMQTTEKKRFDCVTQLTLAFTEDRTKRLNHLVNVVSSAYLSAENTDINDNILRFIKQKQVDNLLPDYVIDDYKRCFGYLFHAEATTPSDVKGVMWI